jgi:hypothetical protein
MLRFSLRKGKVGIKRKCVWFKHSEFEVTLGHFVGIIQQENVDMSSSVQPCERYFVTEAMR